VPNTAYPLGIVYERGINRGTSRAKILASGMGERNISVLGSSAARRCGIVERLLVQEPEDLSVRDRAGPA